MASYVACYGTPLGTGSDDLMALVIDDGEQTIVLGDTDFAEDMRDNIELADGTTERERLASLLTGLSYLRIVGPISFTGSAASAVDPLSTLYDLT